MKGHAFDHPVNVNIIGRDLPRSADVGTSCICFDDPRCRRFCACAGMGSGGVTTYTTSNGCTHRTKRAPPLTATPRASRLAARIWMPQSTPPRRRLRHSAPYRRRPSSECSASTSRIRGTRSTCRNTGPILRLCSTATPSRDLMVPRCMTGAICCTISRASVTTCKEKTNKHTPLSVTFDPDAARRTAGRILFAGAQFMTSTCARFSLSLSLSVCSRSEKKIFFW